MAKRAKKEETRWLQMTLTEGNQKGAVEWLQAGEKITPGTVYYGTAKQFDDDGYNIPIIPISGERSNTEFLQWTHPCILILDRLDTIRRPLLVHQKTARTAFTEWVLSAPHIDMGEDKETGIHCVRLDEDDVIHFNKVGKKKFDGFKIKVVDESAGPGGAV